MCAQAWLHLTALRNVLVYPGSELAPKGADNVSECMQMGVKAISKRSGTTRTALLDYSPQMEYME